ncbi:hypothetical protein C7S13_3080 [Burkholderia cepacia]|nr:hypothetical protein [Burkholderia cepacia]
MAFCKVCGNLRFSQVFVPDRISAFGAISGPNRRLRGVEIDQILIHKAALFVCQRHKATLLDFSYRKQPTGWYRLAFLETST